MCVFCAEVFLLLVGFFWNFVHYTLYRKQSFSRPSERQHPWAVALLFPSSSSFDFFFAFFFLTSSVQYNEKMKSKASLGRALHCSGRSSLEWSSNYSIVPCRPLSATVCYALTSEKQKWVGCERVSRAPGNEWRTEGTNQRAGRRNMRRDVRVTSAKHAWTRGFEQ